MFKNEQKMRRTLGLNGEQSLDKNDNEECKQPTAESNFEEPWKKKRPTKRREIHACHHHRRKKNG